MAVLNNSILLSVQIDITLQIHIAIDTNTYAIVKNVKSFYAVNQDQHDEFLF